MNCILVRGIFFLGLGSLMCLKIFKLGTQSLKSLPEELCPGGPQLGSTLETRVSVREQITEATNYKLIYDILESSWISEIYRALLSFTVDLYMLRIFLHNNLLFYFSELVSYMFLEIHITILHSSLLIWHCHQICSAATIYIYIYTYIYIYIYIYIHI